jgi:hypothetical protein
VIANCASVCAGDNCRRRRKAKTSCAGRQCVMSNAVVGRLPDGMPFDRLLPVVAFHMDISIGLKQDCEHERWQSDD